MKLKHVTAPTLMLAFSLMANAEVLINFSSEPIPGTVEFYYYPIDQFANATSRAERGLVKDKVAVSGNSVLLPQPGNVNYGYSLLLGDNEIDVYTSPGEQVVVDVNSIDPLYYTLSGSPLANSMNELKLTLQPFNEKVKELTGQGQVSEDKIQELDSEFAQLQKDFMSSNPQSPAVAVALMNLDGEDFLEAYNNMAEGISSSILFPLIEKQYKRELKNVELEKKQQELESGTQPAPEFTLKNLEGKDVSLSDFRGKWVILDFWGSWCPWCIKGFPELKEAYKKYGDKLEIIGIDCNESEGEWREGVKKYELPWVNVYNPSDSNLLSEYGVQGFPTKAIINPEGKVANITVGHVPAFFDTLKNLIGE